VKRQQPVGGDRLREKYHDGLLALLSLQPKFSQPGIDQETRANELEQGGKELPHEGAGPLL